MPPQSLPEVDFSRDALLFDVDGTLLDIAPRPEDVHVSETLRESLARLNVLCDGAVALVSGRPFDDTDSLFAPLRLAAIGSHGAEIRETPFGPRELCAPPLPAALRAAFADLERLDPRIEVEDKIYSLAFHYRAARDCAAELLRLARERLKPFEPEFTMMCGKAIIEVKSRTFDKGTAVRKLLSIPPFAGRRPIFCGDDTTDQDVFGILPEFGGLGVSVGRDAAGAAYRVPAPADIRDWLAHLAGRDGGAG
jgi:trehalose 6-phosphate phosphatase